MQIKKITGFEIEPSDNNYFSVALGITEPEATKQLQTIIADLNTLDEKVNFTDENWQKLLIKIQEDFKFTTNLIYDTTRQTEGRILIPVSID